MSKKILIVEDDIDFISILKKKFEKEGFSVLTATDGKEGLNSFEKEQPDLIITDILLPILEGSEMVKKIREKNAGIPVIFLTNIKEESQSKNLKDLKNFDYLVKSDIRIEDIVKKVKRRLEID